MINNGAVDVQHDDLGSDLDHGGCVQPAIFNTVIFFNQFAMTSSTSPSLAHDTSQYQLYSNISDSEILLASDWKGNQNHSFRIHNLNSQQVLNGKITTGEQLIDISELSRGHYVLIVSETGEALRFFKSN